MLFDGALAAQLGREPGNYVASPASVVLGLAMTREGARGETAEAFDRVLGEAARSVARTLLANVATMKSGGPELAIANRLFGDRALALLPAFLEITRRDYGAAIELVDFCGAAEAARAHVNAWVAQATRDKIRELLPERSVDALTRLVLVDAIYMKAAWQTPFDAHLTGPAPFAIDGGGSRDVPTMRVVAKARWGAHRGARVIELPYRASELAMLVVVPDDGRSLQDVEAAYAREGLAPFRAAAGGSNRVAIAMPKFQARTSVDLKRVLVELGLGHAFGAHSDFTGIATAPPLVIASVMHQAWLAADELGTEAAAATAVVMMERGGGPRIDQRFDVDRSFLFFVHDDADNVLFGGRIVDPTA